jgi:hypothetical protein
VLSPDRIMSGEPRVARRLAPARTAGGHRCGDRRLVLPRRPAVICTARGPRHVSASHRIGIAAAIAGRAAPSGWRLDPSTPFFIDR